MKNTGFSLVELLVVIAIMAVLASVAVPVYSHYTTAAKEGVDKGIFQEICHVADIEAARDGATVESVKITISGKKVTQVEVDFNDADTDANITDSGSGDIFAVVKNVDLTSTKYSANGSITITASTDWDTLAAPAA